MVIVPFLILIQPVIFQVKVLEVFVVIILPMIMVFVLFLIVFLLEIFQD